MKKTKKIAGVIYKLLAVVLLVGFGMFAGLYAAQRIGGRESEELTVNTIAVVNMDEGVTINGEFINYAARMLQYPDVNFIAASLEEARRGVGNGTYAAYILIPTDFSRHVVSLNTLPESVSLQYALCPDLRNDIYVGVLGDIDLFVNGLNNNVEYMYMNSVLSEFHSAQDAAGQIMLNDTEDMQRLLEIAPEDITHHVELTPVEMPEFQIEALDLSGYYMEAQEIPEQMRQLYAGYTASGRQAFAEITSVGIQAAENMASVQSMVEHADITKDAAGGDILSAGLQSVDAYVSGVAAGNEELITRITEAIATCQGMLGQELVTRIQEQVTVAVENDVDEYQQTLLTDILEEVCQLREIIDLLSEDLGDGEASEETADEEIASEETSGEDLEDGDVMEQLALISERLEELKERVYTLNTEEIQLVSEQIAQDISSGFWAVTEDMRSVRYIDVNEMETILNDTLTKPFEANRDRISGEILSANANAASAVSAYEERVAQFDMYQYINEEEINTIIYTLGQNIDAMQLMISEQDAQYRDFVYEVYRQENENLQNWQNDILRADELSAQQLEEGLEAAKLSRTEINSSNVEALFELTQKLPYTRQGNMEYIDAYEFMVSPVMSVNIGESQNAAHFHMEGNYHAAMLGLAAGLLVLIFVRIGYRKLQKRLTAEDDEEQR